MNKTLCSKSFCIRVLANLFIVFCICRSIFMCWPFDSHYSPRRILKPLDKLSTFLGLNAELSLFSPNPPDFVDDLKFIVTFDDGTIEDWSFPRGKMMPWDSEDSYKQYVRNALFWAGRKSLVKIRPDLARYILRQTASTIKHPAKVDFYKAVELMPPPEVGMGKPLLHAHRYDKYFSYVLHPGDLD